MRALLLSILISLCLIAEEIPQESFGDSIYNSIMKPAQSEEELMDRVLYTNLAGAALVTVWGIAFWDYFSTTPSLGHEGWFGKDTKYGGADKMGHMYSTYLWSLEFSSLYEYWGMDTSRSMIYGSLSAWSFQFLMELGDSFSESQGFSYEDVVANTVGALFYYAREKYPQLKNKVDLRLEYLPDFNSGGDVFTMYNSMKYLFALKFSGFESMQDNLLKYGEVQLGYYTRGYQDHEDYTRKERNLYVGIGINVSEVLASWGWVKTGKIFNYYQLPYTYIPFSYDFDSESYFKPYSRPYHGSKR
ncbi:DUF2279 domain-containing protein [Sulfurovum sp. NBC37-1]|uniref:DUF2279 domain-containing protein n=1 Tax=Sulfurovum sp. (strain NBC37-1) TaxID=387093 RepID=UPI00015877EA|nr:DUF2279 domain-containing protein [Sulfurovum sp. NBC37-1]BAF71049.1 hypothetical protein SUN_0089 [Sulfurovum sp. NBC37-1]